jgi:hypothetical protein
VEDVYEHLQGITKIDAVVPTDRLEMVVQETEHRQRTIGSTDSQPTIRTPMIQTGPMPKVPELSDAVLPATRWAHHQIANATNIPWTYYQRMYGTAPDLLTRNVNHWWQGERDERLVRVVMNGNGPVLRANLSRNYRVLDHVDLVGSVLQEAEQLTTFKVVDASVDDERLYMRLETPIEGEIKRGDPVKLGLTLRNSEVGDGSVQVAPWILRLVCVNGMVVPVTFRQVHLGSKLDVGIVSRETVKKNADAIWSHLRDWIRFVLNPERLDEVLDYLRRSQDVRNEAEPRLAVANIVRANGLSTGEGHAILERYLRQNDDTQFAMVNAVTQAAHERTPTLRRQHEMEETGGQLLTLAPDSFRRLINRKLSAKDLAKTFGEK